MRVWRLSFPEHVFPYKLSSLVEERNAMNGVMSLSTVVFPPEDVFCALEWAGRLGLERVEIGSASALAARRSAARLGRLREAAAEAGVRVASLHAWTTAEEIEEPCRTAAALDAGLVVVHAPHHLLVECFDRVRESLRRWGEWCAERGIVLTVENGGTQPLHPFVDLFAALDTLKWTLDVKHAYKPDRLGLTHRDYLDFLAGRTANLHLCGIDRSRGVLGDACPPGNDHVAWEELASFLAGTAGDRLLLTVEVCHPSWLSEEEVERFYGWLPGREAEPLGGRIARHAVEYFRAAFSPLLGT